MTSLNKQLMVVINSLWTINDSDNFNNEQLMIVTDSLWIIGDGDNSTVNNRLLMNFTMNN